MKEINQIVLKHYPHTQAIYQFGAYGTSDERTDSDVDVAILLPPVESKQIGHLQFSDLQTELENHFGKQVDLVNLRQVDTVLQKEIIMADRRIFCGDEYAADEFEMLVISFYQKLNEERAEIIEDAIKTGRFYEV